MLNYKPSMLACNLACNNNHHVGAIFHFVLAIRNTFQMEFYNNLTWILVSRNPHKHEWTPPYYKFLHVLKFNQIVLTDTHTIFNYDSVIKSLFFFKTCGGLHHGLFKL